jgi:hypothetical protein
MTFGPRIGVVKLPERRRKPVNRLVEISLPLIPGGLIGMIWVCGHSSRISSPLLVGKWLGNTLIFGREVERPIGANELARESAKRPADGGEQGGFVAGAGEGVGIGGDGLAALDKAFEDRPPQLLGGGDGGGILRRQDQP